MIRCIIISIISLTVGIVGTVTYFMKDCKAEWITAISALITAIGTIALVVVARYGLKTWEKQLKGKKEYELAIRFLSTTYQLRDLIRRHTALYSEDMTDDISSKIDKVLSQFEAEKYECEIIYGNDLPQIAGHFLNFVKACLNNACNGRREENIKLLEVIDECVKHIKDYLSLI